MKHHLLFYFTLISLIILSSACDNKPKFLLRVKLEPGDSLKYVIDVSQHLKTMSLNFRQNVRFHQRVVVRDKENDSVYRLTNCIERIILEQFLPAADTTHTLLFDSDNKDTSVLRFNLLSKTFNQLVNKDFDMWLTHKGQVVKSEFKQLIKSIMPAKEGFAEMPESRLASDASFEQFAASLPEESAGVDYRYVFAGFSNFGTFYPLKTTTNYRVVDITDHEVILAYETTFAAPDSSKSPFVFQGKQKGQYRLDRNDLLALENTYHQNVEMNLALFGFPTTVYTDTHVKVSRIP